MPSAARPPVSRFLGPVPSRKELRALALMTLTAAGLVLLFLFATAGSGTNLLGLELGADFPAFYLAGKILNEHPADQLYNLDLQYRTYVQIRPGKRHLELPYAYPPYVAQLFRPLARMPFALAYLTWACCSALLYAGGLLLLLRRLGPRDRQDRELVWCLALSYVPFLFGVVVGGQLSAIGFFAFAVAVVLDASGQPFFGGLTLALCIYKPTLIPVVAPMLLVTGRYRVLAGFLLGAASIAGGSYLAMGQQVWLEYRRFSAVWFQLATSAEGATMFPIWKFVDFGAFARFLTGSSSGVVVALPVLASLGMGGTLLVLCWRTRGLPQPLSTLHWGAAISTLLVANVYVPIYDCTLVVIPVLLSYTALQGERWVHRRRQLLAMAGLLYLGAWFAEVLAIATRVQPYTLLLAAFAVFQLRLLAESNKNTTGHLGEVAGGFRILSSPDRVD